MAETTADVRRDIELTRERMTSTLAQLEQKLNLTQVIKDNPWPAVGLALGAGFLLSGSGADVKAAAATRTLAGTARDGTRTRIGPALDDVLARLMSGLAEAVSYQVDHIVSDVQRIVGMPPGGAPNGGGNGARHLVDDGASAGGAGGESAGVSAGMGGGPTASAGSTSPISGGATPWAPQSGGTDLGRAD